MKDLPWPPDDPRWEDDAATVPYGSARPAPLARPAPARSTGWGWGLTLGLVVLSGSGCWVLWSGREHGSSGTPAASAPGTPGCDAAPTSTEGPMLQVVLVDDEHGCPSEALYDQRTATLDLGERGRFLMGEPGDILLVGDWDCDGTPTPALYRPSDGRTFQFSAWSDGTTVASATAEPASPNGTPRVVHRDGCDHLVVEAPA